MEETTYTITWHDAAETILWVEVNDNWTWTDAHQALNAINEMTQAVGHDVYVIIHFLAGQVQLPKGQGALANVRYLLSADPSPEQLTIFVGQSRFLQSLLTMATGVFGLSASLEKLRFVATPDEALTAVEAHRRARSA